VPPAAGGYNPIEHALDEIEQFSQGPSAVYSAVRNELSGQENPLCCLKGRWRGESFTTGQGANQLGAEQAVHVATSPTSGHLVQG